jgi:hypothetical protein
MDLVFMMRTFLWETEQVSLRRPVRCIDRDSNVGAAL